MQLFPARAPLESVAIDIHGELMETSRRNKYLVGTTERFSKLVKTVPHSSSTAETVAKVFDTNWEMSYWSSVWLLSNKGPKFTARFFQHICRLLCIHKLFTTTYQSQSNGQAERSNCTIITGLRHYVANNPKDWELSSDVLTYVTTTQVHGTTKCAPFDLVLSRSPIPLALGPTLLDTYKESCGQYLRKWKEWLKTTVEGAQREMTNSKNAFKGTPTASSA